MDSINSDVNRLKEIVQLLHSELKLMQTEIKDLKQQLDQRIDEVYTEIDTLNEKLTTDIQTVQTNIDGKLEYVCGLIDEANGRFDNIEGR
jgi:chromosome segregation ATPase